MESRGASLRALFREGFPAVEDGDLSLEDGGCLEDFLDHVDSEGVDDAVQPGGPLPLVLLGGVALEGPRPRPHRLLTPLVKTELEEVLQAPHATPPLLLTTITTTTTPTHSPLSLRN